MREKPAVVYPASVMGSLVARADMESASPLRQSVQAAGALPEELSASDDVGVSRVAMMGDQSQCKGGWVKGQSGCSSRHRIRSAFHLFLHARHHAGIRLGVAQRRIADARELVGQCAGSLVVVAARLHRQRPLSQAIQLSSRSLRDAGRTQDRTRTMREQHAQVAVAAFGNMPQVTRTAGGIFLRCQAEPAGEVACIVEVLNVAAGGGNHCRSGQQADAGNGQQRRAGGRLFGQFGQFSLQLRDTRFEQADFFDQQSHRSANQVRHGRVRIGQHPADLFDAVAAASRNGNPELPAEPAQRVDTRSARAHPQRAGAMQSLQCLLFDGFDLDRRDVGTARRFEQGAGIGGIGLVALDVGTDVSGRQQAHVDAQAVQPACPVMGRAAGFHNDQRYIAVDKPAFELAARQSMLIGNAPSVISDSQLEYGLGQIDGHGSSMHGGLLSVKADPRPHVDQRICFDAKNRGESIPSINTDSEKLRSFVAPRFAAGYGER
jgi:hypothetical protein